MVKSTTYPDVVLAERHQLNGKLRIARRTCSLTSPFLMVLFGEEEASSSRSQASLFLVVFQLCPRW